MNRSSKTSYSSFEIHLFNFVVGLTLGVFGGIILLSVYHTVVFLIAYSWSTLFSILIPAITLVLAIRVIVASHPVHSLLCLITVFFNTVLLYLSVQAEFLALIFLIVYVGAIAILFLFVIMLLNVKELTAIPRRQFTFSQLVALHLVVPLSANFGFNLSNGIDMFLLKSDAVALVTEPTSTSALVNFVNYRFLDIQMFSETLYTYYSYSFMLTALLLLTAMLGAIILATSATDSDEKNFSVPLPILDEAQSCALSVYLRSSRKSYSRPRNWKILVWLTPSARQPLDPVLYNTCKNMILAIDNVRNGFQLTNELKELVALYNFRLGRPKNSVGWIADFENRPVKHK